MRIPKVLLAFIVTAIACLGPVGATALTENPALTQMGVGLTVAAEGTGLENVSGTSGSASITVTIGGPVQKALLYWAGRDTTDPPRTCPGAPTTCTIPSQPYLDQVLMFDGVTITGAVVGSESQLVAGFGSAVNNIGYAADVTAIVQAKGVGSKSFEIKDGDLTKNLYVLNGATLLVVFTDPLDPLSYVVKVFEGLDFAYGIASQPAAAQVTAPVTFVYPPSATARSGEIIIGCGDATAARPDRIDVTDSSGTTQYVNQLVGADGLSWDTLKIPVTIPASGTTTTVQLFSVPSDQNPDSLLWILGVLRVPVECVGTGTPGYWINHPEAWPVEEIVIGGVTYTKDQAIEIMKMPVAGDKTLTMFPALVAAKLNVLVGADSSCIAATIAAADTWMATYGPAGSGVEARSPAWRQGDPLYETLDEYNNGELCAPYRDVCEP